MRTSRIKPWMVATALAVVGVTGATVVNLAARSQHREDRADVIAWLDTNSRAIADAKRVHAQLEAGSADLARAGRDLRAAQATLVSKLPPRILQVVFDRYMAAIVFDGHAFDAQGSAREALLRKAAESYANADSALARLKCRVELECA